MHKQIVHPSGSPTAISTIFGWTLIGKVSSQQTTNVIVSHVSIDLVDQLHKFWELEELNVKQQYLTTEEQLAEEHYTNTVKKLENGRYMVRLPFKTSDIDFGNTIYQAAKRLMNIESKFNHNTELRAEYTLFMDEYIKLNHMELAQRQHLKNYYLPHHGILKPTSTTTKLRVVFDGSAKGSNGKSLNEHLMVGPTIQNDLFAILLQFRKHKIGFCSDIEKMYRQILVHPDDRPFQSILWRKNTEQQILTYYLNTVTYGTSAAPFLAIRTLKQIAIDNRRTNPHIAEIIEKCFYVDDFICGAAEITEALIIKNQVSRMLSNAGFHLRKWCSNSKEFLDTIDDHDKEESTKTINNGTIETRKLGLLWDTSSDILKYTMMIPEKHENLSKRTILSVISRLFDPLGLLSPIVVTMKLFMQKLWLTGLDWDTPLPRQLDEQWKVLSENIKKISDLSIPRWLGYKPNVHVELHGFADSSEMAYAAVVYLKTVYEDQSVFTKLITAKTKVAPVKQVTLPRLELCAAQLLTKLLIKVKSSLEIPDIKMYGWTDSTIVLAWLSDHPRKWKNFVANRTSYIINNLAAENWRHIPSKQNPADCATRGLSPSALEINDLWWFGPEILKNNDYHSLLKTNIDTTELEKRVKVICQINIEHKDNIINRYSSFTTLIRTTAQIYRFFKNSQPKKYEKKVGVLTIDEIKHGHDTLVKISQLTSYADEIKLIKNSKHLSSNHALSPLTPFIDQDGLLRVGGRLSNAKIPYEQKHPIILHKSSYFTELIVRYYHLKYLHAGIRQLQYLIALKYWIPSVTQIIKRCVYKCTTCIRYRQRGLLQQMGNLPEARVNISTAFHHTGIDFTGPITIRSWKGRGAKHYKSWIAIFVCMATKAVHIELVTELSTDAFIATLRRFVSRRGKPAHIFSDNGTNFVGCNQKLKDLMYFLNSSQTIQSISRETIMQGIQWHFTPPSGPHFGGLWEAGVKSIKVHLNKVLLNASLTYEELSTVLCQVESCLNSRPLCAKFEGDEDPITPGHFLVMKAMQAVPDANVTAIPINRLSRWQYLQNLVQNFWKKWSASYLTQLQARPKWRNKIENIKIGDVVIIKNDQLPPNKWLIGRIAETHVGQDGLVRVVTVNTKNGSYKRPISKLCPLLVE